MESNILIPGPRVFVFVFGISRKHQHAKSFISSHFCMRGGCEWKRVTVECKQGKSLRVFTAIVSCSWLASGYATGILSVLWRPSSRLCLFMIEKVKEENKPRTKPLASELCILYLHVSPGCIDLHILMHTSGRHCIYAHAELDNYNSPVPADFSSREGAER